MAGEHWHCDCVCCTWAQVRDGQCKMCHCQQDGTLVEPTRLSDTYNHCPGNGQTKIDNEKKCGGNFFRWNVAASDAGPRGRCQIVVDNVLWTSSSHYNKSSLILHITVIYLQFPSVDVMLPPLVVLLLCAPLPAAEACPSNCRPPKCHNWRPAFYDRRGFGPAFWSSLPLLQPVVPRAVMSDNMYS